MLISQGKSVQASGSFPDPMRPALFQIRQVRQEIANTFTVRLEAKDDGKSFQFAPGQFNMLYAFGQGEVPISISGDPQNARELVHTIRAVGPVTCALQRLQPGGIVGIRGPFGSNWPLQEALGKDIILMAGGLGLAPLRPIVYHWLAHRTQYGKLLLLYATRVPQTVLYREELEDWQSQAAMEVEVTVDSAATDWHGSVGVITHLLNGKDIKPQQTLAMICGPELMMRFSANALKDIGIDSTNIYISMERNMKCSIGFCGHCQYGPYFICKEGPVFPYSKVEALLKIREV